MIPSILHYVVDKIITDSQSYSVDIARNLHPKWDFRLWNKDDRIEGSKFSRYIDTALYERYRRDFMYLDVLAIEGGVCVDVDMELLKPLDELISNYDFLIASDNGQDLTNSIFGATRLHPAIQSIIDFFAKQVSDWSNPKHHLITPALLTKLLRWRPDVTFLPRQAFYPSPDICRERKNERSYSVRSLTGGRTPTPERLPSYKLVLTGTKALGKRALLPLLAAGMSALRQATNATELNQGVLLRYPAGSYPCNEEIVANTVHGQKIVLDGRDLSITPNVALHGYHEWPEEAFVRRTLRGGDWFLDVGANVGIFSILAASICGPVGRVLAFEPNPRVRQLLAKSAILNWYHDRIKIYDIALGDVAGPAKLSYSLARLGDAQVDAQQKKSDPFSVTQSQLGDGLEIDISVRKLDEVIPVDLPIKILKIDAEGHEAEIIYGSRRLLTSKAFDFILLEAEVEFSPQRWRKTVEGLEMLTGFGYSVASLDWNGFLIPHRSLYEAIGKREGKTLVFLAEEPRDVLFAE